MEPELRALLPWSVVVEKYDGETAWGQKTYASGVSYRAQIQSKRREITNKGGERVYGRTIVLMDSIDPIDTLDRITLPSGFRPQRPNIVDVERVSDERGLHHVKVVCS